MPEAHPQTLKGVIPPAPYQELVERFNAKIAEVTRPYQKLRTRCLLAGVVGVPVWLLSLCLLTLPFAIVTATLEENAHKKALKELEEFIVGLREDERWRSLGVEWRIVDADLEHQFVLLSAELSFAAVRRARAPLDPMQDRIALSEIVKDRGVSLRRLARAQQRL
jgi:hypothetical protein